MRNHKLYRLKYPEICSNINLLKKLSLFVILTTFSCLGTDTLSIKPTDSARISDEILMATRARLRYRANLDNTMMRTGKRHAYICGGLGFTTLFSAFAAIITTNFEPELTQRKEFRISGSVFCVSVATLIPLYVIWKRDINYYMKNRSKKIKY